MTERDKIINERANIIDIIKRWHCAQSRDINGHTIWLTDDNERLADALIANGYGDVAEWKKRAEVAERIAKKACEIVFSQEIDEEDWENAICIYKEESEKYCDEIGITEDMLYDCLKEQAEKEIEEERK